MILISAMLSANKKYRSYNQIIINPKKVKMKVKYLPVALLAIIGLTATSCQKEIITDSQSINNVVGEVRYMTCTINGVTTIETIVGDEAWADFLHRMTVLAGNGYVVSFCNTGKVTGISDNKKVVTYTTDNQEDAEKWAGRMADEGYNVTIIFDEETGIYTCIATMP